MSTKKSVEIKDVAGLLKALTKALSYGRLETRSANGAAVHGQRCREERETMNRDKHSMSGAKRSKRKKRDGLAKLRKKKAERFGGRKGTEAKG